MSSQPLDTDVQTLMDFTMGGLSHDQAVKFLQVSNYNLEAAANKFFEQGLDAIMQPNTGWDGSAFGADRYGEHDDSGSGIPTFNIDYAPGVDHYPHSGAPSRPPSRTSQRSGVSSVHMGDAPLQSIENAQESGVIGNSRPAFGPATKDFYETNQWALVPITTSAEYIPDAAAISRKREEDGPAIIKPLPNNDYLPAALAILHSIPLFRNALLTPQVSLESYWVGDDWWKGSASLPARTVDNSSSYEAAHEHSIIHETQRLMAFLDSSDRAYASVDCLLELDAWKQAQVPLHIADDNLLKFLWNWSLAYQHHTSQAQLNGVLRSMVNAGGQNQECFVLDATVVHHDPTADLTLYDVLDEALFSTPSGNAHIVDVSNVLIVRLDTSKSDATSLDCKIPVTFYADRYLEKNKDVIDAMFLEMKQYEDKLKEIDTTARKLKYHTPKKTTQLEPIDTLKLLKTSMKAFHAKEDDLIEDPRNSTILSQLQSVYESIERKLNSLEEQKNKIRETLDRISSRFKAPIDDGSESALDTTSEDESAQKLPPQHPLTHPYKLCGVSTRPSVVYLLHPDIKSDVPDAKRWWRIEYSTATSDAYILREQLTLTQVVERARSEHKSALLVYANDTATSIPPIPLAEPLQQFVKQDNVKFLEELRGGWEDYDPNAGTEKVGDWDHAPDYSNWTQTSIFGDQWATMSSKEFHEQKADSGLSSTTLTPNTEIEDEGVGMEMQEVHGGMAGWAGAVSNASSDTVGGEAMDMVDSQTQHTVNPRDVEMRDVDLGDGAGKREQEARVQHIEVVEKKGG